ncbi:hypothetical protein [Ralstonia pseudosolanacearum]|uniref:hypothetical protein n=1 Tax=Ralstonia pseudosolanacearum TaxID=1310165 RepID=UPI0026754381|nr:hypothetical protein [Ralstonia pseudosolanacearum]MDO3607413.1 hypothetical protein [Ralstonia pseudosolanacearum]MDO3609838.1 hypothetical protein [Ralstonia pseudosolanacearum]
MDTKQIAAHVGREVSAEEMADMIRSNPIGTSESDVRVRSGVLRFSFGPGGVVLESAEIRKPLDAA